MGPTQNRLQPAVLAILVAAICLSGCRVVHKEAPLTPLFEGLDRAANGGEGAERMLRERLLRQFPLGTQDQNLAEFLRTQRFEVERRHVPENVANPFRGEAKQYVGPLIGHSLISVHWRADAQGRLTEITTWYGGAL